MPLFKRALLANLRTVLRETGDEELRAVIADLALPDPPVAGTVLEDLLSTLYEGADKAASDRVLRRFGDELFSTWYIENAAAGRPVTKNLYGR